MAEKIKLDELMIIEAARHVRDGETVFAGTGMPLVAAMYAQKSHAPNMCFVLETGPIAPQVLPVPTSVSDPKGMHRAAKLGTLREVLGCLLQRGMVDVGFLGGAQIDQYANINSTVIGDYDRPKVRFPGSGGANDIASHAKRILIICRHEKRRFPEKCAYITSPGYIDGPDGRKNAGLVNDRPDVTVVTDMAVMAIDPTTGKLRVVKLMPGVTFEQVQENTGFPLPKVANPEVVNLPTDEDLRILHEEVDPDGEYLGKDALTMPARAKILISEDVTGSGIETLKKKYEVVYDPDLWKKVSELEKAVEEVDALIIRNQTKITPTLVNRAKNLKVIGRAGAGYDNIDVPSVSLCRGGRLLQPRGKRRIRGRARVCAPSFPGPENSGSGPLHQKRRLGTQEVPRVRAPRQNAGDFRLGEDRGPRGHSGQGFRDASFSPTTPFSPPPAFTSPNPAPRLFPWTSSWLNPIF